MSDRSDTSSPSITVHTDTDRHVVALHVVGPFFVCTELMLRTELVLADLDTLAPVVTADEQAVPLVSYAA